MSTPSRTRFIPDDVLGLFLRCAAPTVKSPGTERPGASLARIDLKSRMRTAWS